MYKNLRDAIHAADLTQADLAKRLGKCQAYISHRMLGRTEFEVNLAYQILEILDIPDKMLPIYFPKNGKDKVILSKRFYDPN